MKVKEVVFVVLDENKRIKPVEIVLRGGGKRMMEG
jgi:hypothetical protein